MKKCPFCKEEIEENASFCLYCMSQLEEKTVIKVKEKNKKLKRMILVDIVVGLCLVGILGVYFISKKEEPHTGGLNSETLSLVQEESDVESEIASDVESEPEVESQESSDVSVETSEESHFETSSEVSSQDSDQVSSDVSDSTSEESGTNVPKPPEEIVYKYRDAEPGDEFFGLSLENKITIIGVETVSENGVYVIPETIDGKTVFAVGEWAFCGENIKDTVKTVVVPKNVKNINAYAFYKCHNMTDLYLCGEAIATPNEFLPPKEKCNETITLHASKTCHDRNFRTFEGIYSYEVHAGNEDKLVWKFEEWNGWS